MCVQKHAVPKQSTFILNMWIFKTPRNCCCFKHFLFCLLVLVFIFSSQSTKIKKGSKGDATVLKPTLMAAVPVIKRTRTTLINSCLSLFCPLLYVTFFFFFFIEIFSLYRRSWTVSIRMWWQKWMRWAECKGHSLCWPTTTSLSRSVKDIALHYVTGIALLQTHPLNWCL